MECAPSHPVAGLRQLLKLHVGAAHAMLVLGYAMKPDTSRCALPQLKRIVSRLRKQRAGMVQTPDQYMFCYQALKVRQSTAQLKLNMLLPGSRCALPAWSHRMPSRSCRNGDVRVIVATSAVCGHLAGCMLMPAAAGT
jgi:Protein-tyrosine phosphatase